MVTVQVCIDGTTVFVFRLDMIFSTFLFSVLICYDPKSFVSIDKKRPYYSDIKIH